ncbi:MAG: hypothetical protein BZY88_10335 [SAR202 cluster bacterium Io17-Chloro-G9]|nr:MAG: hypothetical protein BZY88_10335 [SAR202 cluster bacterium Io17-Chloro-G9]
MRLGDFEFKEPLPDLKSPHVLAVLRPWIDVGRVGTLSLGRMERHLKAQEMGRLARPGQFYDFTRYRPRSFLTQGQREFYIPSTIFRYAIREEAPDLIFVHILEPHMHGEDLTDSVVEVLKYLGAQRYSLVGAMYDMVPHTRPLLVSSSPGQDGDDEESRLVKATPSSYQGPTSITSLIPQEVASMGMQTRTFVVHLPQYFQVDEDFTGTARLMEILCTLYHLPNRLRDAERGRQQYASLQNMIKDASEASSLLKRLEDRYDRNLRESGETDAPPLSPSIERFLRELDLGLDPPA